MTEFIKDTLFKIEFKKVSLDVQHDSIRDWIQNTQGWTLVYIYQGSYFNVEPGHYLNASLLFFKESFTEKTNQELYDLKKSILNQFPELIYNTPYHQTWNISPEETVLLFSANKKDYL